MRNWFSWIKFSQQAQLPYQYPPNLARTGSVFLLERYGAEPFLDRHHCQFEFNPAHIREAFRFHFGETSLFPLSHAKTMRCNARERPHELGNRRRRIRISLQLRHLSRTRVEWSIFPPNFTLLAHKDEFARRLEKRKNLYVYSCGANPAVETFWLHAVRCGALRWRHARRADNNNGNRGAAPRLCNVLHHQHYVIVVARAECTKIVHVLRNWWR